MRGRTVAAGEAPVHGHRGWWAGDLEHLWVTPVKGGQVPRSRALRVWRASQSTGVWGAVSPHGRGGSGREVGVPGLPGCRVRPSPRQAGGVPSRSRGFVFRVVGGALAASVGLCPPSLWPVPCPSRRENCPRRSRGLHPDSPPRHPSPGSPAYACSSSSSFPLSLSSPPAQAPSPPCVPSHSPPPCFPEPPLT